jgi:preprotein translocase subunit SecY
MNLRKNKIPFSRKVDVKLLDNQEISAFLYTKKDDTLVFIIIKEKVLITLSLIALIRLGNFVQIPGIDKNIFLELSRSNSFLSSKSNSFFGSNNIPGLFFLNIGPNINASLIIQLLITIVPELKKFQKEEGQFAKRKIEKYIRYLTLGIAFLQSYFFVYSIRAAILDWNFEKGFEICCFLSTGAMIVLWLSEKITKDGIANGQSLLVFLNVLISIPTQIQSSFINANIYQIIIIIITLIITTSSIIFLQLSVTTIPILTSKLIVKNNKSKFSNEETFFPVKLNPAGVMPIVFTSYFLAILKSFGLFLILEINKLYNTSIVLPNFLTVFIEQIIEFLLICFFTNFYSLIVQDPKDLSENLRKSSFFIRGIRPGQQTFIFLEKLFTRQSLIGGIILATNAILLNIISFIIKLPLSQQIGIGPQIIIVGVIIEIIQKIRSFIILENSKKSLKL